MTGNFKFGYLGESSIIESELIKRFRPEDFGKWILGYYANSNIPMIGFLHLRMGSTTLMRIKTYEGTAYDIKAYRLLGDKIGEIIMEDTKF